MFLLTLHVSLDWKLPHLTENVYTACPTKMLFMPHKLLILLHVNFLIIYHSASLSPQSYSSVFSKIIKCLKFALVPWVDDEPEVCLQAGSSHVGTWGEGSDQTVTFTTCKWREGSGWAGA